jgi:hypothetical protein
MRVRLHKKRELAAFEVQEPSAVVDIQEFTQRKSYLRSATWLVRWQIDSGVSSLAGDCVAACDENLYTGPKPTIVAWNRVVMLCQQCQVSPEAVEFIFVRRFNPFALNAQSYQLPMTQIA